MGRARMFLAGGAGLGLALACAAQTAAQERVGDAAARCAGLARPGAVKDLTEATAKPVAASERTPAHCELSGVLKPTAGSRIGVVFRLPDAWNGKVLGMGGGGWAGNVRPEAAAPGLAAGYATLQTDAGHPSPNGGDASWSLLGPGRPNLDAQTDFNWRAIHLMTVTGKAAAAAFYGRDPMRAYYQGCSTGGREGLIEVQRFPTDYDAVIAGAPVYDLVVQTSAMLRTQVFHKDPESNLRPEQLPAINAAVLRACDKLDGVEDGIVANPGACAWDPAELGCDRGAASSLCLTPKQVATVRNAYRGVKTRDGAVAAWPLARGGELEWLDRSVGTPEAPMGSNAVTGSRGLQYFIYRDPNYPIDGWSPDELAKVRASAFAKDYEATKADISPFLDRGGKLILWHGGYDPGPSPLGTQRYYEAVRKAVGPAAADKGVRFFIAPGVYHCGGGPGTDRFDMVAAIDRWVEQGEAPQQILARNAKSGLSRPLCPYPAAARYQGGDPKAAASFACAAANDRAEASAGKDRAGG